MSEDLLLEIGTEEIPSDYLNHGLNELKRIAEYRIKESGIPQTGNIITFGCFGHFFLLVHFLRSFFS